MAFIGHFLLIAALFAVIDSIWIGVVANKFYKKQLGGLLRDKPDFKPAVVFYIVAVWAILVFAVDPALAMHSIKHALSRGLLLGLFGYCAYELTNASTLKNWPKAIVYVDIAWGAFVTMLVSWLAYLILS